MTKGSFDSLSGSMKRFSPDHFRPEEPRSWVFGPAPGALTGSPEDDRLFGGRGNDRLSGGAGDDELHGRAGHDVLRPGSGSDLVRGGDGNDWVVIDQALPRAGELKNLSGGDGIETLDYRQTQGSGVHVMLHARRVQWGESTHKVAGFERILGTPGDDRFEGDASANIWRGGGGRDTYVLQLGGGHDRVEPEVESADRGGDTVELGEGIELAKVELQTVGDSLRISIKGTEDSLTVPRPKGMRAGVSELALATGERYQLFGMAEDAPVSFEHPETLRSWTTDRNDEVAVATLTGLRAFDGQDGDDILSFQDMLVEGEIDVAAGKATIGNTAYTFVNFEAFIAPEGGAKLRGTSSDDRLVGGKGSDKINGLEGNDMILGDASDSLGGDDGDDYFLITPTAVNVPFRHGQCNGGPGWDTVDYSSLAAGIDGRGVQYLRRWAMVALGPGKFHNVFGLEHLIGTDADDYFFGIGREERWFEGSKGNDHYEWGWEHGNRKIIDVDPTPGNQDVLYLTLDDPSRVFLSREGNTLLIDDRTSSARCALIDGSRARSFRSRRSSFMSGILFSSMRTSRARRAAPHGKCSSALN